MKHYALAVALSILFAVVMLVPGAARPQQNPGYDDTPFLPDGKWRVHDGKRPQPVIITPGAVGTHEPPSDAIVLFDGKDLSKWQKTKGGDAGWKVEKGYMEVPPRKTPGSGSIMTRDSFGDCQLHIEWMTPAPPKGTGQGRGNSGIILMKRYEVQVLDSHENITYPDGQAASMYGQYPPLVNASRKPAEWQVYDIIFIAPRFDGDKLVSPARTTVFHNGVVMHHDMAFIGATAHKRVAKYAPHNPKEPLLLQDHGNPIRFRNIWLRPLKGYDEK